VIDFQAHPVAADSVRLGWTVNQPLLPSGQAQKILFKILRSPVKATGPYEEIASVAYEPEKQAYVFWDTGLTWVKRYFYKLVVEGSELSFGPVSVALKPWDNIHITFKALARYRSIKLEWRIHKVSGKLTGFRLLRSKTLGGPYKEIAVIPYDSSQTRYEFFDKSLGTTSKYFYKLAIKGIHRIYGPVMGRQVFSPPATHQRLRAHPLWCLSRDGESILLTGLSKGGPGPGAAGKTFGRCPPLNRPIWNRT